MICFEIWTIEQCEKWMECSDGGKWRLRKRQQCQRRIEFARENFILAMDTRRNRNLRLTRKVDFPLDTTNLWRVMISVLAARGIPLFGAPLFRSQSHTTTCQKPSAKTSRIFLLSREGSDRNVYFPVPVPERNPTMRNFFTLCFRNESSTFFASLLRKKSAKVSNGSIEFLLKTYENKDT